MDSGELDKIYLWTLERVDSIQQKKRLIHKSFSNWCECVCACACGFLPTTLKWLGYNSVFLRVRFSEEWFFFRIYLQMAINNSAETKAFEKVLNKGTYIVPGGEKRNGSVRTERTRVTNCYLTMIKLFGYPINPNLFSICGAHTTFCHSEKKTKIQNTVGWSGMRC